MLYTFTPGDGSTLITSADGTYNKDITGPMDIKGLSDTKLLISKPGFGLTLDIEEIEDINGDAPAGTMPEVIAQLRVVFPNAGGDAGGSQTLQQVADAGNETTKPLLYKDKIFPLVFVGYDVDTYAGYSCSQEFIDFMTNQGETYFYIDENQVDYGYFQYADGLVAYFSFDDGSQDEDLNGGFMAANFDDENTLSTVKFLNANLSGIQTQINGQGNDIAYLNNQVSSFIAKRPGLSWANASVTVNNNAGVAFGAGIFVLVNPNSGTVLTSPNGIDWTSRGPVPEFNHWISICYGNGLFVAISDNGTNRVMTSPDGITWTARAAAAANAWQSVCWGNGLFVAVSSSGTNNRVMTSPDGITWTSRTSAANNTWKGVCWGKGLFVAGSYDGTNRIMTSPDGTTWTLRSHANANGVNINSICYGTSSSQSRFVAVSDNGAAIYSTDGLTWNVGTNMATCNFQSVCFANGIFVAVNYDTAYIFVSYDGVDWNTITSAGNNNYCVGYGNGVFIVGTAGATVQRSGFLIL